MPLFADNSMVVLAQQFRIFGQCQKIGIGRKLQNCMQTKVFAMNEYRQSLNAF